MTALYRYALFLIAASAAYTPTTAQTVYRCGSTYSQIPCPGAAVVDTRDVRTKRQKTETDKANERNAAAARAMEKKRLKEEAMAEKEQAAVAKEFQQSAGPSKAALAAERANTKAYTKNAKDDSSKEKKANKKEPPYFTAVGPIEKKKPKGDSAPSPKPSTP
jgi:hypothetical protein